MMQEHSPPVVVPHLRTDRLLLREFRLPDFEAFAAHCADPRAMALTGVLDRRSARRFFAGSMGEWLLQGAGWWALELRASGTLVGHVGAFFRETSLDIELAWNVFSAWWGQGIATEAATEVVRYAFEVRREPRVTALIDPRNDASLRVAAHVGMTHEADVDLHGTVCGRFVRAAP